MFQKYNIKYYILTGLVCMGSDVGFPHQLSKLSSYHIQAKGKQWLA